MFKEHILFRLSQIGRSIWLRPVLYALGAILAIVLGPTLDLVVPEQMHSVLQDDAVANVLTLLASPMLAVAIFSLGTMVSAFQISSDAATPRARPLVTQDRAAQNAISTFLGAFVFAILGIIGISAGLFSDGGRLILFVLSILLIALVIATFIGWMNRLTNLGGVTEIIDQVEHEAMRGFRHLAAQPWLGGKAAGSRPKSAKPLTIGKYGHIQHIDIEALNAIAEQIGEDIFLAARPGVFVHPGEPVLFTVKAPDEETAQKLKKAFIIGGQRTFRTDPVYGLVILSEIASRALSPAVNDPGTAIDVIETASKVLGTWRHECAECDEPEASFPRVRVPDLDIDAVLDAAFADIIRDGAGDYRVVQRLMQLLTVLAGEDEAAFAGPAGRLKKETLAHAQQKISLKADFDRLKQLA